MDTADRRLTLSPFILRMMDTQTSTSETITAPSVAEEADASQPPRRAGKKETAGTMVLHHLSAATSGGSMSTR